MQPPIVLAGAPLADARRSMELDDAPYAIVVDPDRRLHGWISPALAAGDGRVADRARRVEAAVSAQATLKDAFSEMLLYDAGWVAVLDGERFLGVLTPESLHTATRRSIGEHRPGLRPTDAAEVGLAT